MYLLFLAMLTVLTADCQAWTWDAWQHDTPLFEAVQLLFVFVGILEREGGWGGELWLFYWLKLHENPTLQRVCWGYNHLTQGIQDIVRHVVLQHPLGDQN